MLRDKLRVQTRCSDELYHFREVGGEVISSETIFFSYGSHREKCGHQALKRLNFLIGGLIGCISFLTSLFPA